MAGEADRSCSSSAGLHQIIVVDAERQLLMSLSFECKQTIHIHNLKSHLQQQKISEHSLHDA